MNKSKFLKRSLATLLAILMVVAMVPMSAFAAAVVAQDVPTARVTDNPGYEIALNGIPFTWNTALGRYETDFQFVNDSHGSVPGVQLSMIENAAAKNTTFILTDTKQTLTFTNKLVDLKSAALKENELNYGQADYIFTLETRTETETGQVKNSYQLVVKARIRPASAVTELLGVYPNEMPDMKTYTIENNANGGGKVTIYMTLNKDLDAAQVLSKNNVDFKGSETNTDKLKKIFVVDPTVKELSYANKQLTIVAENGHTDTYEVVLTHEEAFETFELQKKKGDKKTGEVTATYKGEVFNKDPQKIIIDLPYEDFYVDGGTDDDSTTTGNNYDTKTPHPDYAAIDAKVQALFANWTTDREEAVVSYGAAASDTAAKPGETQLNMVEVNNAYNEGQSLGAKYPGINPKNGNNTENYLIFTSLSTATADTRSPKNSGSNTNGLWVDTQSRKVDSDGGPSKTDHTHAGEVEIIVRVPLYNPSTKLVGIQIKGANVEDKTNESTAGTEVNTLTGSETWSQYIPVNGTDIDITVPKDALPLSTSPKDDEVGNKRAYIKLWGAYGAEVEIPWDFVASAGNPSMASNGFDTDGVGDNNILTSNGMKASYATSDSTILLTEKKNSTTPNVKEVLIEVKAQDGDHKDTYKLKVRELASTSHIDDLDSITLYKADGTEVAKATKVPGKATEWTIPIPYWMGSQDGGADIDGCTIGAVAKNGGRISYRLSANLGTASASLTNAMYQAFVKEVALTTLTGQTANSFIAAEPNADNDVRGPADNSFILRVWDADDIMANGTDHKITFTMPAPETEQRISSIKLGADKLTPNGIDIKEFETTVDNVKKVITVNLPYEYKGIDQLWISDINLDGIGSRVYWADKDDTSKLQLLANETDEITIAPVEIKPDTGADWQEGRSTKLYVFSEESYSRLKHGYSPDTVSKGDIAGQTLTTVMAGHGDLNTYNYYTEYTVVAKIGAAEQLNRLNNTVKASDDFVTVDVDAGAQIITVNVPHSYVNDPDVATTGGNPAHTFKLDFTTDGEKARVYMGGVNARTGNVNAVNTVNVQILNNGVPAGGIEEYIAGTESAAIVPNDTLFWVNKETIGGKEGTYLRYAFNTTTPPSPTIGGNLGSMQKNGILATEAIVAAEYSVYSSSQENGGTRPYRINVKVADPVTDPSIKEVYVGDYKGTIVEDADAGSNIINVNMPATSDPHQPLKITFKENFTTATIDGESFDEDAYYIVNKHAPVTIVATSESGVNKRYILKVADGNASSDTSLSSVRVGGYPADRNGSTNEYLVTVGDNVDVKALPLYVTTTDSKAKVTVNSLSYTEGMIISLDGQSATIIVTAENGDTATYTLSIGKPAEEKPSDKITDLNDCSPSIKAEVADAIDLGIVKGAGNNKFLPTRAVTRKEFAVMIARADIIAAGKASNADAADTVLTTEYLAAGGKYTDIASLGDIYKAAINYCSANEIISGTGNGTTFSPEDNINREQAATMLARWTKTTSDSTTNTKFSDWAKVSNWAKGAVNGVTSTNPAIMNGVGGNKFAPQETVRRDVAATLVKRVYVNYSSK